MENKIIFNPGDIVHFHSGLPIVKVIWMQDDLYLFKGEILDDTDKANIGIVKRNFYRHKFYKSK